MTERTTAVAVRERGIVFSAESVLGILAGRKTQTRRVVLTQPRADTTEFLTNVEREAGVFWPVNGRDYTGGKLSCPFGVVGDRLYVREAWGAEFHWPDDAAQGDNVRQWSEQPAAFRGLKSLYRMYYKADRSMYAPTADYTTPLVCSGDMDDYDDEIAVNGDWMDWRSPLFMPRWASRIVLELTDVRVRRVQAITSADAIAEGCVSSARESETDAYHRLWDELNAKRGYAWALNPWVYALTFKRVEP